MQQQDKIALLRNELRKRGAFAVIFLTADPHISEYVAPRWKVREWLSEFCGSAGTLVVTRQSAALWTDYRYFLEAAEALEGSSIMLMKMEMPETPVIEAWIASEFEKWRETDAEILVDGECFAFNQFRKSAREFEKYGFSLNVTDGLVDNIWSDRPPMPTAPMYEISAAVTGETREERITFLRELFPTLKINSFLLTALDEIAWILNLRGSDVEYNPVFYAYLLVNESDAVLFTHCAELPEPLRQKLAEGGVGLAEYEEIESVLKTSDGIIGADADTLNVKIARSARAAASNPGASNASSPRSNPPAPITPKNKLKLIPSPIKMRKARKNTEELASLRNVMKKDGLAMVTLLHWLEQAVENNEKISELTVSTRIEECRAEQEGFIGSSFTSIVGFREHGAIIHYVVNENSNKSIEKDGILLIDSGGQYRNGTTDITRTVPVGRVAENIRLQYTLVLKGHISLARAIFPEGTTGAHLDSFARRALWEHGLNYGHGTGHGVGFALNVHEGPQNISFHPHAVILEPGMVCSNEPGYYQDTSHGIRIENLIAVECHPQYRDFLRFETLSLCPLELNLVKTELLSAEEREWINTYHGLVYESLSPLLNTSLRLWLEQKTRTL
ncbi:MAG: aminopeptidase family protein P [Salinispira sp.]